MERELEGLKNNAEDLKAENVKLSEQITLLKKMPVGLERQLCDMEILWDDKKWTFNENHGKNCNKISEQSKFGKKQRRPRRFTAKQVGSLYKIYKSSFGK